MKNYGCLIFLLCLPVFSIAKQVQSFTKTIGFIENKGQITDQFGNPRSDIQYKVCAGEGLNIFIGKGTIYYQWSNIAKATDQKSKERFSANGNIIDSRPATDMYRMDVHLVGANTNATIIAIDKQDYYESYYTAPFTVDYGTTISSYNRIIYKNIYPNIDWILYIPKGQTINEIEYEFAVQPGGNVNDIQLQYDGNTELAISNKGSLQANTPMGSITEQQPYSYEENGKRTVASNFIKNNNRVSFQVAAYTGTLIIDPTLLWASYFGGSGIDYSLGVTNNSSGDVYIAGQTASTSNIATVGAYQTTYAGGVYDISIAKFNSTGTIQWATYYGSNDYDMAAAITCDVSGNLYITGYSAGSGMATSGAYQTSSNGVEEVIVAKFNSGGTLQWSTYYGGSSNENAASIAVDASGNIYICGLTQSTSNIASSGSYQSTYGGGTNDGFLAKFNNSGTSLLWATYFGGSSFELMNGVTVDGSGNVYMTGESGSSGLATSGAYQTSNAGSADAIIAEFNSSGSLQWATYYGGSGSDAGVGIAYDGTGNVYISGTTASSSGIATTGAYQTSYGGTSEDAFLAKFSTSGSLQWGTYYGSSGNGFGRNVACDASGNPRMTGYTTCTSNVSTSGSYQTSFAGGTYDAFLGMFSTTGTLQYGTYFGGSLSDQGYGISLDPSGNVYITGNTSSTSSIATSGSYQTSYGGGGSDGFILKLGTPTPLLINQPYQDTLACPLATFNVQYTINGTFTSGNIFTAQLSNSSGSFVSPVNIGSVSSTASGSITVTIPAGTASGTSYRIRIISSSPADTSADDGVDIHIIIAPSLSLTTNSPICAGDSIKLSVSSVTTGLTFAWHGPATFSSSQQNTFRFPTTIIDSGYYYVTASYGSCNVTDSAFVVIHPVISPSVTIQSTPAVIQPGHLANFTSTVVNAGTHTYQWIKNHVPIPGATDSVYSDSTLAVSDTICLLIHSTYICARPDTAIACEEVTSGITGINQNPETILYPNPNTGEFTIKCAAPKINGQVVLELFDITGRKIKEKIILFANNKAVVSWGLDPGLYYIRLNTERNNLRLTLPLIIK